MVAQIKFYLRPQFFGAYRKVCTTLLLSLFVFVAASAQAATPDMWLKLKSRFGEPSSVSGDLSKSEFLTLLKQKPKLYACDFPARTYLISQEYNLDFENLIQSCSGLQEFRDKVPFETLSLVFASEEITSPASVMGHIFLQIDGVDKNGQSKSYAISFLTDLDTINLAALTYSILISGRQGYITLGAAQTEIAKYVDFSKRTVWSVPLDVNASTLKFIQLYVWELKTQTPDYLFIDFNCATFIQHLLDFSNTKKEKYIEGFVTPRELFKHYAVGKEDTITVYPSVDWMIRSLKDHRQVNYEDIVQKLADQDSTWLGTNASPKDLLFAIHYTEKKRRNGQISDTEGLARLNSLQKELASRGFDKHQFYVDNFKSPIATLPPQKLSIMVSHQDKSDSIIFGYRPASKDMLDNGTEYFTLQESVLGYVEASVNVASSAAKLEKLKVFSMASFDPFTFVDPKPSFKVDFTFRRNLNTEKSLTFKGMVGLSVQPFDDVTGYFLIGAGAGGHSQFKKNGLITYRAGVYFDLIGDSRLNAFFETFMWGEDEKEKITTAQFQKSIGLKHSLSLSYSAEHSNFKENHSQLQSFIVGVHKYF